MNPADVSQRASSLCRELRELENPRDLPRIAKELTEVMSAYWGVHPHGAMEMLEVCVKLLPLPLAHAVVRRVVQVWHQEDSYDPKAGGSADHCYLSALILSENFDLADRPWVEDVLPKTLEKELSSSRFSGMRDGKKKEALVRGLVTSRDLHLQ